MSAEPTKCVVIPLFGQPLLSLPVIKVVSTGRPSFYVEQNNCWMEYAFNNLLVIGFALAGGTVVAQD